MAVAFTIHNFDPTEPTDLALRKGDLIEITDFGDSNRCPGWWAGRIISQGSFKK